MLALWWAKFSPASHSVPQAWLTSVIYQNLWQAGRRGSRQKEPFWLLRRHEITWWGVGITQMNKLRVGILILGKHLSLWGELLLTHSPIVSPSSLLHRTSTLFPQLHFAPLVVFFLWSHLIRSANVLSCLSKHLLGIQYSSALPQKWNEERPWRNFRNIRSAVVSMVNLGKV